MAIEGLSFLPNGNLGQVPTLGNNVDNRILPLVDAASTHRYVSTANSHLMRIRMGKQIIRLIKKNPSPLY